MDGNRGEWTGKGLLGQRGRRASMSLPSGLDHLLEFAEFSWQNKADDGEKDYFDEVAEAEAGKHAHAQAHLKPRHVSIPEQDEEPEVYNPTRSVGRRKQRYALGEGAYDPIRSDSEVEDLSVDELSEVESPSPTRRPKTLFSDNEPKLERKVGTVDFGDSSGKEDEENGTPRVKKSKSRRKRASVSPIKIVNSNYKKSDPLSSNRSHSPTPSSSSIKSLIRDKLSSVSRSIPTVFMKRKADEYKLQAFVAILFLTIILLVGSIYVIHQEKELQKAYFNKIRFSGKDRKIRVSNLRNREVLTGLLGNSLTKKDKAWPCLAKDHIEGLQCLEWMNKARLYFSHHSPKDSTPTIECYGILWQGLSPDFVPQDCYHIGEKKGFYFYGGGEMGANQWPLNRTTVPLSPFITGNGIPNSNSPPFEWGRTIRSYFVNAPGAAISIPPDVALQISVNDALNPGMLCLAAKRDEFAHPTTPVPVKLYYTICTGENVRDVLTQLADQRLAAGLSQEEIHFTYSLARAPIWRLLPSTVNVGPFSEASLLNHTDVIAALHLSEGIILLDESWQKHLGDLEMDPDRFPTIAETFNITRRRGFKVALTVQPFFSTQSTSYLSGVGDNLWIRERSPLAKSGGVIPALTTYKSAATAVVLDVTQSTAVDWVENKINQAVQKYGVDALFLDLGTAQHFPEFYEFNVPLSSPDAYKEIMVNLVRRVGGVNTIGVSGATKAPKPPTFVSLSPVESSWEGLQSIIPNFLTMGVAGFPLVMPGSVGGDFKRKGGSDSSNPADFEANKPERNLYIRWLELVHFLPVIQYTYLPSDYDQSVIDIARNLNIVRNNKIYKAIKKAIDEALVKGLPVIRPLWMTDPNEPACLKSWDEFTIGSDILVAPILTFNSTERNIYLPKGRWRDEMDGTSTKGEKWLNNYRVRENQIAYFTKLADSATAV